MKLRIFQIITIGDLYYGAQKHVFELTEQLINNNHEVVVLTGSDGVLVNKLNSIGCKTIVNSNLIREINIVKDIRFLFELITILKACKPDIVATHSSKAGVLGRLASWKCGIPAVFTAHGWSFEKGIPYLKRKVYEVIERMVGKITAKAIVVSNDGRDLAIKSNVFKGEKLEVIYYGVNDNSIGFRPSHNKVFTLVMVAGFRQQKDHSTLIKSLNLIKDLDWQLYLLGDGELINQIKEIVILNGLESRISFLGNVENVSFYLNQSDLMVLSTHYEGLPIAIIEGLSFCLPMVVTNVSGNKEAVIDYYNGILVKREDVLELSQALRYCIENRKVLEGWGDNSRILYDRLFSIEEMYKKTIKLYQKIVDEYSRDINS
jgi:glycosyltransferase involved in cell wall biosynthesis